MGGRSRAAAQLLAGKGFEDVYNLKGGIMAWQGHKAEGPADMGMALLRGDETPVEIIVLAYGMEDGLKRFYLTADETMVFDDPDVKGLLKKLAGIEEKHKQRLFDLYLQIEPSEIERDSFEKDIVSDIMEGGFTTEEFLEKNRTAMKTVPDLLSIAMMLEAQAMDLYVRYAQKIPGEKGRTILQDMAEEEKMHLKSLGRLMDKAR